MDDHNPTPMYRSALKSKVQTDDIQQVPLLVYGELRSRWRPAKMTKTSRHESAWSREGPPASFVLFHADLKRAAEIKGVLGASRPDVLWSAIAQHAEIYSSGVEDELDA
jgi:hypothetical protein